MAKLDLGSTSDNHCTGGKLKATGLFAYINYAMVIRGSELKNILNAQFDGLFRLIRIKL